MYRVINLTRSEEWSSLMAKLPIDQRDVYFSPEYYRLHEDKGDGKAQCFVFEDGNNLALYPFLLNEIDTAGLIESDTMYYDIQGAYGYNGVAASSYDDNFIREFYAAFNNYCKTGNIIAEFIRFHPVTGNQTFSRTYIDTTYNRRTLSLDLRKGYDYIWENQYDTRNRNMIRKAEKNNLQARISCDVEAYLRFYDMYTTTMQKIGADDFYLFPQNYFESLPVLLKNNQCVIEVLCDGRIINSIVILFCGKYAHYHLSARDSNYSSVGANNFGLDSAIKLAIESDCTCFHFGGGISDSEDDPLFRFKSSFSHNGNNFYIGKKVHDQEIYGKVCNAWKKREAFKSERYSSELLCYRR